jgi:predicted RNase H-like HicB family nuclease
MIQLQYSLIIEATHEPDYFGFFSIELEGFTGIGHSVEDCLYKARWGMFEHVQLLREEGLPIPPPNPNPTVLIRNESQPEAAVA